MPRAQREAIMTLIGYVVVVRPCSPRVLHTGIGPRWMEVGVFDPTIPQFPRSRREEQQEQKHQGRLSALGPSGWN